MFKCLCLSGGGIFGFIHLGVLQYLEEKKLTRYIDTIVCTSIGAVIGCLLSIGMKSKEIYDEMENLDNGMLEYNKMEEFFEIYGMDSGEYFMAQIMDMFMKRNISPILTFSEHYVAFHKHLVITGTNVTKHMPTYFHYKTHPNMRILDAVRISISIPFLLSAVKCNDEIYVDGGITDNYPIEFAKNLIQDSSKGELLSYIVGSYIDSFAVKKIGNIEDFIQGLFACCLNRENITKNDPCTIYTVITDVSAMDFGINSKTRKRLWSIGYENAKTYVTTIPKKIDTSNIIRKRSLSI
jgi:hypothetical protein